ncbi:MAG: winged helix-turn-helix transcriptional regulator [Tissierellia bacterium]|nr:winged helix-turn-helix transcriptional regulator [Tissierellia bacterium]
MDYRKSLNDILVRLFAHVLDIEEKCLKKGEFSDLTIKEMHIIDSIGIEKESSMSETAKELGITSGTLTIAIDNLIRKGYVQRNRSKEDRRVVLVKLTEKGSRAYRAHEDFHKDLVASVLEVLEDKEKGLLIKVLSNIDDFFKKKYHI